VCSLVHGANATEKCGKIIFDYQIDVFEKCALID
jgi:hypothetical protein